MSRRIPSKYLDEDGYSLPDVPYEEYEGDQTCRCGPDSPCECPQKCDGCGGLCDDEGACSKCLSIEGSDEADSA
jgi:hypothetical protein